MAALTSIPGIGRTSRELLEAVGFHDVEALATAEVAQLAQELERANAILKIAKRTPATSSVAKWIDNARDIAGVPATPPPPPAPEPVNYEQSPQVIAMLAAAPFAIPLPARVLLDNQLGVADIPAAISLTHYSGDLDVRVEQRLPANRQAKASSNNHSYVRLADNVGPRLEIDTSKLRSTTDNMGEPQPRVAVVKTSNEEDRLTLLRAPRLETNKGRDPKSRRYIRGVLHTHPVSIYLGALATLVMMAMIPVAAISAGLLLISGEMPDRFPWVPAWLLIFPASLPLFGIFYLIWGVTGNCRVCGQKLFVHRPHLKNARAHRIRGLGYILPLCIHIVLFNWFRCTHCGTPVRLKK